MTTICSNCGRDLSELEVYDEDYVICHHCNWFIPKGSESYRGRVRRTRGKRSTIGVNQKHTIMSKGGNKTMIQPKEKKKIVKSTDEVKAKVQRTLTCSKCGAIKKAGVKRVAKWKGKTYFCRECRLKMKGDKSKVVKKKK